MMLSSIVDIPSIRQLNDGSWELVARKAHMERLRRAVQILFLGSSLDEKYNPFEPDQNDTRYWGYDRAKKLIRGWLLNRALQMICIGGNRAAAFYEFMLDRTATSTATFSETMINRWRRESQPSLIYIGKMSNDCYLRSNISDDQ
jgi:hypothetical protein